MSRLFTVAILALLSVGICESANLAEITWKHGVNTKTLLADAYKGNAKAIVADVILGYHKKGDKPSEKKVPVINQDKKDESDFSLDEFITDTIEHQKTNSKIIQLNFAALETVHDAFNVLLSKKREIKFPIWLNAEVLTGPGASGSAAPVDGLKFIDEAKKLDNIILSIGWKTIPMKDPKEGYTNEHTKAMEDILKNSKITTPEYKDVSLNFPINAFYAVKSKDILRTFYDIVKNTNPVTFTVRSQKDDKVDAKELEAFIKSYGTEHIYMDLPDDLRNQINLSNGASSLVQFGLLNLITLAVVTIFRS